MKTLLLALLIASSSAFASQGELNIMGGYGFTTSGFSGVTDSKISKNGLAFGASALMTANELLKVGVEFSRIRILGASDSGSEDGYTGSASLNAYFNNILGTMKINAGQSPLYFQFGAGANIYSADISLNASNGTNSINASASASATYFAFMFGAGFDIPVNDNFAISPAVKYYGSTVTNDFTSTVVPQVNAVIRF